MVARWISLVLYHHPCVCCGTETSEFNLDIPSVHRYQGCHLRWSGHQERRSKVHLAIKRGLRLWSYKMGWIVAAQLQLHLWQLSRSTIQKVHVGIKLIKTKKQKQNES